MYDVIQPLLTSDKKPYAFICQQEGFGSRIYATASRDTDLNTSMSEWTFVLFNGEHIWDVPAREFRFPDDWEARLEALYVFTVATPKFWA